MGYQADQNIEKDRNEKAAIIQNQKKKKELRINTKFLILPLAKAPPGVKNRLLMESVVSVHGVNILFAGY